MTASITQTPDTAADEAAPFAAASLVLANSLLLHLIRRRVIDGAEAVSIVGDALHTLQENAVVHGQQLSAVTEVLRETMRTIVETTAEPKAAATQAGLGPTGE